ncbi:hypothetical protein F5Y17DRAFT_419109 [Xylariaceae sp. FL0594]|nr:hypothetical protein F5Y17DRAFT_419109 [Xylariaceae sp. FL0594]
MPSTVTEYDEQKLALLQEDAFGGERLPKMRQYSMPLTSSRAYTMAFLAQVLLFVLNLSFLAYNAASTGHYRRGAGGNATKWTISPAETSLESIVIDETGHGSHGSLYTGEPSLELDEAWAKLLKPVASRLSEEEMIQMNRTSVALSDGSGYLGYLESYHMLHCVKRIYQSYHPDHYSALAQRDHCLDVLREGIMCQADVTIRTVEWATPTKLRGVKAGPRKCMDWGRIEAWADSRSVNAANGSDFIDNKLANYGQTGSIGPTTKLGRRFDAERPF